MVFGVPVAVPCRLPGFRPTTALAEVRVELGRLPDPAGAAGVGPDQVACEVTADGGLLFGTGPRALVRRGGREIVVDPGPDAGAEDAVGACLQAGVAALMRRRGLLVLHAGAVATGAGAVLIAGRSGAGKSTLCAALHAAGHPLLTDDVAVLGRAAGGGGLALMPGPPAQRLCPDAAHRLGVAGRPGPRKLAVAVDRDADPRSLPPAALLVLEAREDDDGGPVLRAPAAGLDRFRAVVGQLYAPDLPEGRAEAFSLAAELARTVAVERISRPVGRWSVGELVDLVAGLGSAPAGEARRAS